MTAQRPDKIIIKNVEYSLFTNPLEDYWTEEKPRPHTFSIRTSCWRGYIATWEILNDYLYLIDIKFNTPNGDIGMDYAFPDNPDKVLADWYTGELRIPLGDLLEYIHGGYDSTYDSDWTIKVEKGKVIGHNYKANY
jgi:hypothetical protein